jgi:hypothetical protein
MYSKFSCTIKHKCTVKDTEFRASSLQKIAITILEIVMVKKIEITVYSS